MPATAYAVAAPNRSDVLSATLRSAYCGVPETSDTFAEMIEILDRIDVNRQQR
ncbi:hypothetical protein [Sphingomonas glacialis]|uniref:hypothetical protein n=1 Tax=Sphingomonas glacialis TaxID=658225 RepID=UPI001386B2D5|nr:hypothetical protein [Sphingomonas glacialis]